MTGAAWYLTHRSFKNWVRGQARKLGSPRYLLALAVGVAYLWFLAGARNLGGRAPASAPELVERVGALLIALTLIRWWLFGADRSALAFTPAEVQFLFPAPVSRRELIVFKLLRAQILLLINALVWTFLLRRTGGAESMLLHGLALWTLFSTLFLHRLGAALVRSGAEERLRQRPGSRGAAVLGLVIIVTAALLGVQLSGVELVPHGGGLADMVRSAWAALDTPVGRALLFPFRILLRPVTARDPAAWLAAMGPALLLLLVHLIWVVRADRRFEEAALEASLRRAESLERWKREGRVVPSREGTVRYSLPLRASGHPIMALVWKNLSMTLREDRPSMLFAVAVFLVVSGTIGAVSGGLEGASTMLFGLGSSCLVALIFFGPQWIRNDLRADLPRLSVLRSFPLSGATLMTGEVLSSALVLSVYQVLLVLITAGGALGSTRLGISPAMTMGGTVVLLLVLPVLNVVAMGIQNAGALLFPGWVRSQVRPGGVEALGQHMVSGAVGLILLLIGALPAAAVGYGLVLLLYASLGAAAAIPGTLLAMAALVLEAFLLLDWLGSRFDALDPSQIA